MHTFYTVYVWCLFLAFLIGLGLALYAVRQPRTVATRPFATVMFLAAWWGFCAAISAIGPSAEWATFWGIPLRFTAVILLTPSLLIFTLAYTGRDRWLTPRYLFFLLLIPAVSVLMAWSYRWHDLFVHDVLYERIAGYWLRTAWSKGAWFQIYLVYSYLALLTMLLILARYAWRAKYPYRQQAILVFLGSLLPIIASVFATFDLLPGPDLDLIILAFISMGVAFAASLYNYQLLNIMPIARDAVVENMSDMVVVLDGQNFIVDVNPPVENLLGYGRRHIIGRPATEVFAPWSAFFKAFTEIQQANTIVSIPTDKQTTYLDLSISPLKRQNRLVGRVFVLRNISHLKKTEAALQTALRDTQALYAVAQSLADFSNLPDLLQTIVDVMARSLVANRITLIGFDVETQSITQFVVGGAGSLNVVRIAYPELMEGLSGWVLHEMKPALSPKDMPDPRESESVQQRRRDTFCGSIIVVPLIYHETLQGTVTAINRPDQPDFTQKDVDLIQAMATQAAVAIENGRLYKAEQEHVLELKESNLALNAFARMVAHDLKNPLGLIVGYTELMLMQAEENQLPIDGKGLQDLQMISQQGYKMSKIIDNLLLLATIRNKQEVEVTAVPMAEVVHEVLHRLTWQIEQSQATVYQPEQWPSALGFAPWIEEIWANYISNALKYGGSPPTIQLGAEALGNGENCYWVRDNGEGLTPEQQVHLFKEFSRLAEHQNAEGTGLGLSIVEYIARRLDGRVGVESKKGVGSKFYFILPAPIEP